MGGKNRREGPPLYSEKKRGGLLTIPPKGMSLTGGFSSVGRWGDILFFERERQLLPYLKKKKPEKKERKRRIIPLSGGGKGPFGEKRKKLFSEGVRRKMDPLREKNSFQEVVGEPLLSRRLFYADRGGCAPEILGGGDP